MAAWTTSRIFTHLTGYAHNICRRTVFSCFREITEMPTRHLMQPARSSGGIFNQIGVRAASNGSTALRDYFKEEMKYQRDMLDCESISDLPTFKDFELKVDEFGDATFTRTHQSQTVTVWLDVDLDNADVDWHSEETTDDSSDGVAVSSSDESDDSEIDELDDDAYLEEGSPQVFHVTVTSHNKTEEEVTFICNFTVDVVYNDMYEEDVYDILRVGVGKNGVNTTEMSTTKMPTDLFEIYYDYLRECGITQEFLNFLRNTFLPTYLRYCFVEQFLTPMKNLTK